MQEEEKMSTTEFPAPDVFSVFGHGWDTMKKYFPELLLVIFLEILLSVPIWLFRVFMDQDFPDMVTAGFFSFIYGLIVMTPVSYGASWVFLKAARGEPFRVQDMFFAYQRFGNVLLANILVSVVVGIGFLLLIIPGIIFACKLAFVPYLVMDRKLEATDAIRTSWEMTSGHTGTIFMMGVTSFFVAIGGLIFFIVGILPATIWISLAFATIYMLVSAKQQQATSPGSFPGSGL